MSEIAANNVYWFYKWSLGWQIVLCIIFFPIFIPILVWPKLKIPMWQKIAVLVVWIIVMFGISTSSSVNENSKDIVLNITGISENEIKKDDRLSLKIKTEPVTVDEITINGESATKKGFNTEYSFEKTYPEGNNTITVTAKKGDKKTEKIFSFKVDLSERKVDATIKTTQEENFDGEKIKIDNKIPGLSPVDVYLNFEKRGFKTEKKLGTDYSFWYSNDSSAGIDYNVTTYTEGDVNSVVSVQVTAMLNGEESKDIITVLPFLKYSASLPYENANAQKAVEWVETNFNNDKARVDISGVTYTIYAPTNLLRMLRVEKQK